MHRVPLSISSIYIPICTLSFYPSAILIFIAFTFKLCTCFYVTFCVFPCCTDPAAGLRAFASITGFLFCRPSTSVLPIRDSRRRDLSRQRLPGFTPPGLSSGRRRNRTLCRTISSGFHCRANPQCSLFGAVTLNIRLDRAISSSNRPVDPTCDGCCSALDGQQFRRDCGIVACPP